MNLKQLRRVSDMTDPGNVDYKFDKIYDYESGIDETEALSWATDDNQLILCDEDGQNVAFVWKLDGKDQIAYKIHPDVIDSILEHVGDLADFYGISEKELKKQLSKVKSNLERIAKAKASEVAKANGFKVVNLSKVKDSEDWVEGVNVAYGSPGGGLPSYEECSNFLDRASYDELSSKYYEGLHEAAVSYYGEEDEDVDFRFSEVNDEAGGVITTVPFDDTLIVSCEVSVETPNGTVYAGMVGV